MRSLAAIGIFFLIISVLRTSAELFEASLANFLHFFFFWNCLGTYLHCDTWVSQGVSLNIFKECDSAGATICSRKSRKFTSRKLPGPTGDRFRRSLTKSAIWAFSDAVGRLFSKFLFFFIEQFHNIITFWTFEQILLQICTH